MLSDLLVSTAEEAGLSLFTSGTLELHAASVKKIVITNKDLAIFYFSVLDIIKECYSYLLDAIA